MFHSGSAIVATCLLSALSALISHSLRKLVMKVTITFTLMPGQAQVESVTLRIAGTDFMDALAKALNFVQSTLSSIEPVTITLDKD